MEHNRLIAFNSVSSRSPQTVEDTVSHKKLTQFSIESILSERNSPSVGSSTKSVTLFSNSPFQSSSSSSSSCSPSLPSLTPPSTPVSTSPSSNVPCILFTEKITPPSLPIGIAVARQRKSNKSSWPLSPVKQESGRKTTDSVSQRFHTKCQLEASHSPQPPISPLPKSFSMGTLNSLDTFHQNRIKTEKSKTSDVGTPTVTLPPDYRLARDSLTGQLFLHLLPSNWSYNPSPIGSIPNESPLSIQPVTQNVAWLPSNVPPLPSNGSSSSAIYPVSTCSPSIEEPSLRHSHSQPVCKHDDFSPFRTERAIQACMSDEESDNLMISESPPPSDSSDKITSSCQADMDAEMRTVSDTCEETRELLVKTLLDSDPEVPYDFSDIHPKSDIWSGSSVVKSEATFNLISESQSVPTLPVRSEEVINFINNRGLDRLVDSIESLSEFDCDAKINTTSATSSFTKNTVKSPQKTKISHGYSKEHTSPQSISCNEGLKLLSALAEQRALEEETSAKSLRRHSVDCQKSLNNDNPSPISQASCNDKKSSTTMQRLAKRRNRSESCISAINASDDKSSPPSNTPCKTVSPISEEKEIINKKEDPELPVRRKRKDSSTSSFDPWMIRRSERIFLHESYALSGLPIPDARRELFEKTPSRKSKNRCEASPSSEFGSSLENNSFGEPPDFKVTLKNDERVLVNLDSLFYAGSISSMKEPDNMFFVTLDGVKIQNRHHYSKEDLLKLTLKEVKPQSCDQLPPGTRVCAFWAGQQKCLYAGKVVNNPSPYPMEEDVVFVEFDDGDKGRICIKNIRLLPSDFPMQKEDDVSYKKSRRLRDKDKSEIFKNENSIREASKKQESIVEKEKKSNSRESPAKNSQLHKSNNYRTDQSKQSLIKSKQNLDCSKNADKPSKKKTKTVEEDASDSNELIESQSDDDSIGSKRNTTKKRTAKTRRRPKSPSFEIERTIEMPERQLWEWNDKPFKRVNGKSKYRKFYHREIVRGDEVIKLGDCAIFISTGRPNLPYVGRIDSMWESGSGNMIVRVRWFYHPEETKTQPDLVDPQGALFESRHYDENDIQTISHKCSVLRWLDYQEETSTKQNSPADPKSRIYYFGGDYDPLSGKIHLAAGVPLQKT